MPDTAIWLENAARCPSPNCDERAVDEHVSLLVIHNISLPPGKFGGPWITDLFLNRLDAGGDPFFEEIATLKVSSHLLIRRDGELIQYVPLNMRAWHAGQSNFCGREACNDFSIGIELEGTDETPYTDEQYRRLVEVTVQIMKIYPAITPKQITGHSNIAPGRKTDPGPAFDWKRYQEMLREQLKSSA